MKPAKWLALLSVLLLLAGCDLRNRQSSENFIPAGTAAAPRETVAPAADPTENQPVTVPGQTVKTVWSVRGTYKNTYPPIDYSYELPFIDLGGSYAAGCNREIDNRFGIPARESVQKMERFEAPDVKTIRFWTYTKGEVLTLWVERTDPDGAVSHGVYSVLEQNGEKPTAADFCSAAGIAEEELLPRLKAIVEQKVAEKCGAQWDPDDVACRTVLTRTLMQLTDPNALRLYLDQSGGLVALVEICDLTNAAVIEEIPIR